MTFLLITCLTLRHLLTAVVCVQSMSQKQADALAALDVATNDRLNAISVATQQGIINLYQVKQASKHEPTNTRGLGQPSDK